MIAAIYAKAFGRPMRARSWIFIALAIGGVFGLIAGLNAGLLAATFVAILWYSWETRKLLDSQLHSGELVRHPWLSATALRVEKGTPEFQEFARCHLQLPIDNHGQTPAYITEIEATGQLSAESEGCRFTPRERPVRNQVIVPGDSLDLRLGTLSTIRPPFRYTVITEARIAYDTADGGSGVLTVGFRYADDGEWTNLDTTYSFTLSSGSKFLRAG